MVSVIGIIISIALLSLGVLGDDRQLRREAQRLTSLLAVAQEEAVMQGREFGLELMLDSYRFVEYDAFQSRWIEVTSDDTFRARQLPEDVQLELWLEDKIVLLKPEPQDMGDSSSPLQNSAKAYAPHVMIFSSGESTPFELHVVRPDRQQSVAMRGDVTGTIEFIADGGLER